MLPTCVASVNNISFACSIAHCLGQGGTVLSFYIANRKLQFQTRLLFKRDLASFKRIPMWHIQVIRYLGGGGCIKRLFLRKFSFQSHLGNFQSSPDINIKSRILGGCLRRDLNPQPREPVANDHNAAETAKGHHLFDEEKSESK